MSSAVPDDTAMLPLTLARRLDELCCRFESDWKAVASGDQPPRLEAFLSEFPEAARPALIRELLKIEMYHRRRAGDEPLVDDYRHRLPDLDTTWLANALATLSTDDFAGERLTPVSMPEFLQALQQCTLLQPSQVSAALEQADAVQQPAVLASWLVNRGWLTPFQARHLLAGRRDELILGSYRLLEPLGKGGMGWVFKAHHLLMNRVVAIKRIRPDAVNDPSTVRRFRVEMQAAAQLSHPNVVVVHDAEESKGRLLLVMEYCEGVTLTRLVERRGALPAAEACEYVRQACLGLQHAFERGLVHRDLKPDNLMLCGTTVKILDFGLARLRSRDASPFSSTKEGMIVGTVDYMAPEQAEGEATVCSDLYSLGCTLYFLLAGRPPFPGGSVLGKCLRHRIEQPKPLTHFQPAVPPEVQAIVWRLMAKEPADRFQTPAETAAALATLSLPHGPKHPSPSPTAPAPTLGKATSGIGRRVAIGTGTLLAVVIACLLVFPTIWRGEHTIAPTSAERPVQSPRAWQKSSTLPIPPEQAATYGLAFSPDGRLLAATFGNNESSGQLAPGHLRVWEVADGRLRVDREIKHGPGNCVAFSPEGGRLAWGTGSWNHEIPGHVALWDVANSAIVADFEAHPLGVVGLAFQPHGDLLVTSGREGKVRLWDHKSGKSRGELKDAGVPVVALAFSPDGKRLVTGAENGTVDLWDMATQKRLDILSEVTWKPVRGLAFTAESELILAVTKKGQGPTANLLAWQGRKPLPSVSLGDTEAYCLAVVPDRTTVLVGCQNKTAKLFETVTRRELQTLPSEKPYFCLAFSPTGRLLATSGGWFGPVQLWEEAK